MTPFWIASTAFGAILVAYTGGTNENITIPSSFEGYPITGIGDYAFNNCTSITSVTIPSSVTSIGSRAFDGCTNLTSVTIPDSVTYIGSNAFKDCTSLASIKNNYKAFALKDDSQLLCRDYEFYEGEWSENIDNISIGHSGYHFCTNLFEIFNYYHGKLDEDIAIYECEIGDNVVGSDSSRYVTNAIKPVKRLSRVEILKLLNE